MKIVKEKSTNETSKYLKELESRMGFPIRMIQVDNGPEFVNDGERTELESAFEKTQSENVPFPMRSTLAGISK